MKTLTTKPAFTLIEMIMAITVFTIFIGFAISTFLAFHRADQDALTERSLVMDSEAVMNELSDATRQNLIDYDRYTESTCSGRFCITTPSFGDALNEEVLYLISPDGEEKIAYTWDSDEETLSVQYFDSDENPTTDEELIHSQNLTISAVNFRIFPSENPFEDRTNGDIQYQPMVTFDLSFMMPGRVDPELTLDLRTTVTSRFYQ